MDLPRTALVVVDVQKAFDDHAHWSSQTFHRVGPDGTLTVVRAQDVLRPGWTAGSAARAAAEPTL